MNQDEENHTYPRLRLQQWLSLRLQLLWVYEREMAVKPTPSGQGDYSFQGALLVVRGWAQAGRSERKSRRAVAGQWLLLHQGKRWQRFSPDCRLLSIGYRFQMPTGAAVFDEGLPLVIDASRFPQLEKHARKLLRVMGKSVGLGYFLGETQIDLRDYLLSQNTFSAFVLMLSEMLMESGIPFEATQAHSNHVLRALEIIRTMPPKEPLKSAEVARRIGLSQTYLDRLMVVETGHTIHQQVEQQRLQQVKDALQSRSGSLKTIAYDLGFCTPSHFHSWFRQRVKMTPLQFRQRSTW